jgi:hypothetical protein
MAVRPYVRRLVLLAPPAAMADPADWVRRWTEAGADALGLETDAGDPAGAALLAAMRAATDLPLEVQAPAGSVARPEWAAALARAGVDWLLPAEPPDEETATALAAAGVAWAWPLAAGPAPADARRLHRRRGSDGADWTQGPARAERSLGLDTGETPSWTGGADTLVVVGPGPEDSDPAATLAEWRN